MHKLCVCYDYKHGSMLDNTQPVKKILSEGMLAFAGVVCYCVN